MCRYCLDTGIKIHEGTKCFCVRPKNAFFGKAKGKKKANDMLPSGHKHTNDHFIKEVASGMWFTCKCGDMHKVAL